VGVHCRSRQFHCQRQVERKEECAAVEAPPDAELVEIANAETHRSLADGDIDCGCGPEAGHAAFVRAEDRARSAVAGYLAEMVDLQAGGKGLRKGLLDRALDMEVRA